MYILFWSYQEQFFALKIIQAVTNPRKRQISWKYEIKITQLIFPKKSLPPIVFTADSYFSSAISPFFLYTSPLALWFP